jgi:hypothetical protein
MFLVGVLAAVPPVWAKPPVCDRDKPEQYDPACVCPEAFRDFAITGRLPTDFAQDSALSVYPQGGAEYVICVPPFWNGGMVYASMGTVRLNPNEKEGTIVTVAGQLVDEGVPLSGLFNQAGYGFAVVAPPQLLSVPSREADLELFVNVVDELWGSLTFPTWSASLRAPYRLPGCWKEALRIRSPAVFLPAVPSAASGAFRAKCSLRRHRCSSAKSNIRFSSWSSSITFSPN